VERNTQSLFKLRHRASIQGAINKQEHPLDAVKTFYTLLHADTLFFYANSDQKDELYGQTVADPDGEDKVNLALDSLFKERGFTIQDGT
jgi:hypothetical protein